MKKMTLVSLLAATMICAGGSAIAATPSHSTTYLPESGAYVGLMGSAMTSASGGDLNFAGIYGGYQFNKYFALEGSAQTDLMGSYDVVNEQMFSVLAKGMIPVSKRVTLYAGGGASYLRESALDDEFSSGLFMPTGIVGLNVALTHHLAIDVSSTQSYANGTVLLTGNLGVSYHFS
jgi:hypothetical protein